MPTQQQIDSNDLFLTGEDREPVQPSMAAKKHIIRAPLNLAIYDDQGNPHQVLEHVIKLANNFQSTFQNQWTALQEKWRRADNLYWMAQKESDMPELTLAKVSASVFYRIVRRLADGGYNATFTDEMPVKFKPDIGIFDDPDTKQKKAVVAEALNRWGEYCMKKTDLKTKAKKSWNWVYKYGNHIAYVPYDFEIERSKRYVEYNPNQTAQASDGTPVFQHSGTGQFSANPHPTETHEVEYDKITKDEVGYYPLSPDQCYFDNRISDLDRQTCFIHRSDITRPEIWSKAKAGIFTNVDKITKLQQFQQYDWEQYPLNQRITDSDKTTTDTQSSELYGHYRVWILLPKIEVKTNKKGEVTDMTWGQNVEDRRYVLDMIGKLGDASAVCVRFSESPYWSNGIPYVDAHSHEDDSGWWSRGLMELLNDNVLQEQVAKGQLMDNSTLLNRRPIVRVIGRCRTKDMTIGVNKVFDVTSKDALEFIQIPDQTQNLNNRIEFIKKDSEDLGLTPGFMLGEGVGGRASATEFATIRDQSSASALGDVKGINMQLNGGYMKKLKEYAPQFLDKDMVIQMAGQNLGEQYTMIVKPDDFNMDLVIDEIAVQEFENKATMRQILLNMVQLVASPAFAPFINIAGFLERVFMTFSNVFPNPDEILNKDPMVQELMKQWLLQAPPEAKDAPGAGMPPGQGQPPNLFGMPNAPQGLQFSGVAEGQPMAANMRSGA